MTEVNGKLSLFAYYIIRTTLLGVCPTCERNNSLQEIGILHLAFMNECWEFLYSSNLIGLFLLMIKKIIIFRIEFAIFAYIKVL